MPSLDDTGKHRRMYARRRKVLIEKMGGRCQREGCDWRHRLEFHHLNGKGYQTNRLSRWRRIGLYEREAAQGLLQLRCHSCHLLER